MANMEHESENSRPPFNMSELRDNLPNNNRRGLSRYYSGKSQSFTCMADVQSLEDLKKEERPDVKNRKKYLHRQAPPLPCRRVSSSNQFATPIYGM